MYSYISTPVCARCSKAVYAAEQVIGPGRKVYHKPCLTCASCETRLDSYKLVEHDLEPYCKPCHVKHFGTVDLRHANLPTVFHPSSQDEETSPSQIHQATDFQETEDFKDGRILDFPIIYDQTNNSSSGHSICPVQPARGKCTAEVSEPAKPLSPVSTGSSNSPTRWRPPQQTICPACQKVVYFAEQVKASGQTWHKLCLKCTECKTRLDSSRLTEKDGIVYCRNCYGKLYGPQGGGYALAGRRMG